MTKMNHSLNFAQTLCCSRMIVTKSLMLSLVRQAYYCGYNMQFLKVAHIKSFRSIANYLYRLTKMLSSITFSLCKNLYNKNNTHIVFLFVFLALQPNVVVFSQPGSGL